MESRSGNYEEQHAEPPWSPTRQHFFLFPLSFLISYILTQTKDYVQRREASGQYTITHAISWLTSFKTWDDKHGQAKTAGSHRDCVVEHLKKNGFRPARQGFPCKEDSRAVRTL